jgi:hypothetical protein
MPRRLPALGLDMHSLRRSYRHLQSARLLGEEAYDLNRLEEVVEIGARAHQVRC